MIFGRVLLISANVCGGTFIVWLFTARNPLPPPCAPSEELMDKRCLTRNLRSNESSEKMGDEQAAFSRSRMRKLGGAGMFISKRCNCSLRISLAQPCHGERKERERERERGTIKDGEHRGKKRECEQKRLLLLQTAAGRH